MPSSPRTFTTFAFMREVTDGCPNAHVRQQTGSILLLDCRAYELVSAAQLRRLRRRVHPGRRRGTVRRTTLTRRLRTVSRGFSTGFTTGASPAPATRRTAVSTPTSRHADADGWSTEYVGIPADGTPSTVPFSSSLLGADSSLGTLAFGGPEICSPCFPDGSTGNPVHRPNGDLVQGMAGSIPHPERIRGRVHRQPPLRRRESFRLRVDDPVRGRWKQQRRRLDLRPKSQYRENARGVEDDRRRDDDRPGNRRARDLGRRIADRGRPAGLGIRRVPGTGIST